MKTFNCLTLLCLSAVLFSCKKEADSRIKNNGIASTVGTLAASMPKTYKQTSNFTVSNNLGFYAGDFNGDGHTDVFQPYNNNGLLGIYVHNLASPGQPTSICNQTTNLDDAGAVSIGFVAGDYDGDGRADLIQCWNANNNMALNVLRSTGTGFVKTWEAVMPTTANSAGLFPVDINRDGKTDIAQILGDNNNLRIIVYRSTGTGYELFSDFTQVNNGISAVGFFVTDFENDGISEIVQCWNDGGRLGYIIHHFESGHYIEYFRGRTTQGAGNTGLIPVRGNISNAPQFVQAWNDNGSTSFFIYTSVWSPNTPSGYDYSLPIGFTSGEGAGNLAWLSVKHAGETGALQVWNDNGRTAFIIYTPRE
ncbi:Repeat domain-containing protein [Chitinophaga sp. YR573]|uniref:FG-GAP repeat domain-containing protein n=1 Tax=Chitinophaga sp. YR573 TaxID=1881040 RepID=UPI0008C1D7CB|nr:VCBS repeat-containing protein [Chitinophaga sp. YR573]SEW06867.1 Repeat domain-containing protein [Chitinophaga sp. YR573]